MQYAGNLVSELLSPFKSNRLFGSSKKPSGTPEARKREEEQLLKSERQQKQQQQSKKQKQSRLKNQISQPKKQPQPQQQQQQQRRRQEEEQHKHTQQHTQQQKQQQQQQQQQRQQRQLQSRSRQSTLLNFSSEELPSLPWDQQESIKNTSIQSSRSVDEPLKRQSIQRRSSDKSSRKHRQSREKPASLNLTQKIEREYIEVSDEKDHTPLVTPQERSRPPSSEFYSSQYGHSHSDESVIPREKRSSASLEVYSTELRQTIYRTTMPQATADYSSRSDLTSSQSSRSSLSQSSLSQSSLSQSSSSQSSVVSTPSLELYSRNNTNENLGAFEHEGRLSFGSPTLSASADGAYRGVGSRKYGRKAYSLYVPSRSENSYDDDDGGDEEDDDDDDDNVPIGLSTPRRPPAQRRPLSDSLTARTKISSSSRRSSDSMLLSGVNLPPARYEQRDTKSMSLHEYHKYQQEMVVVQLKKNQEKASRRALSSKKLSDMNTSRPMGLTLIQRQQEYKEQLTSMVGIQNKPVSKFADGIKSNISSKRHSAVEYGTIRRTLDGTADMENRKRSNTVDGTMQTATDVASKRKSYVDASPSTSVSSSYSKRLGAKLLDEMGDTRPNITASTFVPPPPSKYHPNSNLQSQSLPSRHMSKQMHSIIEEKNPYYLHGKSCSESVIQKRAFPQPERSSLTCLPSFQHSTSSLSSSSSTNHSSSSGSRTAARKSILSNAHSSGSRPLSAYYGAGVQTEKKSRRKSAK